MLIAWSLMTQDSKYGAPLCETCMMELYRNSADTWRRKMESSEKMQAQYEKLFGDSRSSRSKATRKAKEKKAAARHQLDGQVQKGPLDGHQKISKKRSDAGPAERNVCAAKSVTEHVMEQLGIGGGDRNPPTKSSGMPTKSEALLGNTNTNNDEVQPRKRKKLRSSKLNT